MPNDVLSPYAYNHLTHPAPNRTYSGPQVPFSQEIMGQKYLQPGETFTDLVYRVSNGLADTSVHHAYLLDIFGGRRFIPAGRVLASIGSEREVTPYNCFVSGPIADSFVSGPNSIMQMATEGAQTMRVGGGIGYDFSTLRPRGSLIRTLKSQSSGPMAFMDIYNAVCRCVSSAGHRRGAQMGVLRVDHPDIESFITAKANQTDFTSFNLSVAITDKFMQAVQKGDSFDLVFEGVVHKTVDAQELWNKIMDMTWDWAEPGVLFIDRINALNNLYYCETIAATNPCGEQPLPPYGACLLGSFNLTQYLVESRHGPWQFNFTQLERDVHQVVQAMDNVVDRAIYPLVEHEREAHSKRRMGLGVTGLANTLEAMGTPYASPGFLNLQAEIMTTIRDAAYQASAMRASEKGAFDLFNADRYLEAPFIKGLPQEIRADIRRYGIRNSHLTSVAPTGTISLSICDNVSSGIEPVFATEFTRTVIEMAGPRQEIVRDYGVEYLGVNSPRVAAQVTAQQHVDVLCVAARAVDSAVSKTCTVTSGMSRAEFSDIYMMAWQGGAKGCTTFRPDGKRAGVLVEDTPEQPDMGLSEEAYQERRELSCSIDPLTGQRDCS